MHEQLVGEATEAHEGLDRLAVAAQAGRPTCRPAAPLVLAVLWLAALAPPAVPAERGGRGGNGVAHLDVRDVSSHRFDDPGGLVAEEQGKGERIGTELHRPVGVAHSGRHRAHENLVRCWVRDVDVLDDEVRTELVQDRCLHLRSPSTSLVMNQR
ncbi:hypothetical protein ACVW00_000122 [Marmoricola sp. URHA0025 HA25]